MLSWEIIRPLPCIHDSGITRVGVSVQLLLSSAIDCWNGEISSSQARVYALLSHIGTKEARHSVGIIALANRVATGDYAYMYMREKWEKSVSGIIIAW